MSTWRDGIEYGRPLAQHEIEGRARAFAILPLQNQMTIERDEADPYTPTADEVDRRLAARGNRAPFYEWADEDEELLRS